MIKQRFLGLALALALLGSIAFATTANAADDSVVVSVSVASVLTLTVDYSNFSFGDNLTFIGGGNGIIGACANPGTGGTTFLGPYTPGVKITVQSSENYTISRDLDTRSFRDRLFVRDGAFGDCDSYLYNRGAVTDSSMASGGATASTEYENVFSFDVNPYDDATGNQSATVKYTAMAS